MAQHPYKRLIIAGFLVQVFVLTFSEAYFYRALWLFDPLMPVVETKLFIYLAALFLECTLYQLIRTRANSSMDGKTIAIHFLLSTMALAMYSLKTVLIDKAMAYPLRVITIHLLFYSDSIAIGLFLMIQLVFFRRVLSKRVVRPN